MPTAAAAAVNTGVDDAVEITIKVDAMSPSTKKPALTQFPPPERCNNRHPSRPGATGNDGMSECALTPQTAISNYCHRWHATEDSKNIPATAPFQHEKDDAGKGENTDCLNKSNDVVPVADQVPYKKICAKLFINMAPCPCDDPRYSPLHPEDDR